MKPSTITKSLQKQAQLRRTKTPQILAEQAALNRVLLSRKSGSHDGSQQSKRQQILAINAAEHLNTLNFK